jgi:AICAR transformylase/IMP cyclohydrolase PurH
MDPNRPIGLCRAGAKNHDRGIVTPDRDEVERLLAEIAETKHKIARERRAVRGYTIGSIEP